MIPNADTLFSSIENTEVSMWIVGSDSLFAFPGILAVHTIGLALLAGLNGALDLRLLGAARGIPPAAFTRFLPLMWVGLWLNVASGVALVIAYPTKALTNPVFYLKLTLVAVAMVVLGTVLRRLRRGEAESSTMRVLAAASLAAWTATIFAGRFLAYTCSRLTVDLPCP
jgi:hypothetical protein